MLASFIYMPFKHALHTTKNGQNKELFVLFDTNLDTRAQNRSNSRLVSNRVRDSNYSYIRRQELHYNTIEL